MKTNLKVLKVKNKIASKPFDPIALDTNDEALDAEENDHDVNKSSEIHEEEICVNESDEDYATD